ncbi:8661_t:CDS:1, partial [Funneliformis caledonium]
QKNTVEKMNEQSTDYLPNTNKLQPKQKKYRTTKKEIEILSALKVYKDKLPDDAIASVYENLSEI